MVPWSHLILGSAAVSIITDILLNLPPNLITKMNNNSKIVKFKC